MSLGLTVPYQGSEINFWDWQTRAQIVAVGLNLQEDVGKWSTFSFPLCLAAANIYLVLKYTAWIWQTHLLQCMLAEQAILLCKNRQIGLCPKVMKKWWYSKIRNYTVKKIHVYGSCSVVSNSLWLMDCSPPGSSVHGILQAILEWFAIPSSSGTQTWTWANSRR